ncbi:MAG: flagellar basal body P-ring protein FlgI [Planctomycetota bacterium]
MHRLITIFLLLVTAWLTIPNDALGRGTALRNICRIKGQEENTITGLGLVVGLNGTGEAGDPATMRKLARALQLMGSPVSMTGRLDAESLTELRNISNVALVMVSATIPATGARRGDKIDCSVSALNGKGLTGGRLVFADLTGPLQQGTRIYGTCQGLLQIDNSTQPMDARIHGGCQIQQDVFTPFHKDGFVTLILDQDHANFQTAEAVVKAIQGKLEDYIPAGTTDHDRLQQENVHAVNASNIRVKIPNSYRIDPVAFVAELLETAIYDSEPESRVYINTRSGSIQISGDVQIGDVIVAHRNLIVETSGAAQFATFNPDSLNPTAAGTSLDNLVGALKTLSVPADDIIEIIRGIKKLGKLHAKLIIE